MGAPIAIVGMACRFPGGADDPAALWRLLRDGVDATGEVPAERWDVEAVYDADPGKPGKMYTRRGGFLARSIRDFDAAFFGISGHEASYLDPQQRLNLETAWHAVEDAGMTPAALARATTGVFMGATISGYL
jgi:acyl transferase domain-containing protein